MVRNGRVGRASLLPSTCRPPEVAPLLRTLCRKELTSTQKTPRVKNLLLENHSISGNDRMNPIFN